MLNITTEFAERVVASSVGTVREIARQNRCAALNVRFTPKSGIG
jgi:hypothetical protein